MLGILMPFNLAFANSDLTKFDGDRGKFIEENLSRIIEIVNSVPGLELSDLRINIPYVNVVKVDAGERINVSLVKEINQIDFEVGISAIKGILGNTIISYDVDFNSNSSYFSFWKIRLRCEDGIEAYVEGNTEEMCGKSTAEHTVSKDGGNVSFKNNNEQSARATVKFRAFDSDGNWLGSRENNVRLRASN